MKKIPLFFLLFCYSFFSFSQAPISKTADSTPHNNPQMRERDMFGLKMTRGLQKNEPGTINGYILYAVPNSPFVYLLNRKGEVVHQWKGTYAGMASVAYLQDDGSIIENAVDPDFPVFAGGGEAGRIEKLSWDNKLLWDFEYATEQYLHHHDFAVMPNGHILAIAWEAKSAKEVIDAGRKPDLTPKAGLWPDKIVEIEPLDKLHGKIVWEWHIWDHIIQDVDSKKPNFGNPADHPELMDINVGEPLPPPISEDSMEIQKQQGKIMWRNQTPENMGSDIYHFNAIKYNADLDQIVFSSPHISEIFIIDHSTTSAEAAGHKGGRWGKGGDFLYRWGNPQNYKRGDSTTEILYGQHDVRWIEKGMPGEGHLTLFNNNHYKSTLDSINYSAVFEIAPPTDAKGNYYLEKNKTFGPQIPLWVFSAPDSLSFWSSFISGAQRLSNGNTFIDEGARGRFFEVTKDGKMVWEFLNPYRGDLRKLNGDPFPPNPLVYITFRANFIPADHPALTNKKLEPLIPQPAPFVMPAQQTAGIKNK